MIGATLGGHKKHIFNLQLPRVHTNRFWKTAILLWKWKPFSSFSVFSLMNFFDLGVDISGIKRCRIRWRIWEMDWNIKYRNICEWKYWKTGWSDNYYKYIFLIQSRMLDENAKIIRRHGTRPVDDEMQEFRRNLPAWGSRIRKVINRAVRGWLCSN